MKKIISILSLISIVSSSLFGFSLLSTSYQVYDTGSNNKKSIDYYIAHVDRKTEKLTKVDKSYRATNKDDEMIIITKNNITVNFKNTVADCVTKPNDKTKAKEDLLCKSIFKKNNITTNVLISPLTNIVHTAFSFGTNLKEGLDYSVLFDKEKFYDFIAKNNLRSYQKKLLDISKAAAQNQNNYYGLFDKREFVTTDAFGNTKTIEVCKFLDSSNVANTTKLYAKTWKHPDVFEFKDLRDMRDLEVRRGVIVDLANNLYEPKYGKIEYNNLNIQGKNGSLRNTVSMSVLGNKILYFIYDGTKLNKNRVKLLQAVFANANSLIYDRTSCRFWPKHSRDIGQHILKNIAIDKNNPKIISFLSVFLNGNLSDYDKIRKLLSDKGIKKAFDIING